MISPTVQAIDAGHRHHPVSPRLLGSLHFFH
jgi:hypothetical protein